MIKQLNEIHENRITKVYDQLKNIKEDNVEQKQETSRYLYKVSSFLIEMFDLEKELCEEYFTNKTYEELLELNHSYYEDIDVNHYETSYANPKYAATMFGDDYGPLFSSVYANVRQCVGLAFEHRTISLMHVGKGFIQLETVVGVNKEYDYKNGSKTDVIDQKIIDGIKQNLLSDLELKTSMEVYRKFNPEFDIYSSIIHRDLSDKRYIFRYGMYISHNEIELVKFFENCPKQRIKEMANTYTEAFIRGYERKGLSFDTKKSVNMGYHIGFESVMIEAIKNFEEIGLKPLVYYDLKGLPRPRIMNTKPNKQFEYDHRFDDGLYFDEEISNAFMETTKVIFDKYSALVSEMAGPAVMEVFGEKPFSPEAVDKCVKYSEEVTKLKNQHMSKYQQLFNTYLPRSNYSFVLISYPVPEIGKDFESIFMETIKVNTLDEKVYMKVQQTIIDALDQGESVKVTGRNGNKTELVISLNDNVDTSTQTNFNNCTADVNVPVGEVFTSPKLQGTQGKLHVQEVYLHGLKYVDLEIDFEDGMISSYRCGNFQDEEKNINFVHENMIHPHTTLPLGEFAIGTNTTAYVMAKKFDIEKIIPILIGEKMGPHFAIGDTCYTWSEEVSVYNPDGREIVARENEKTALRKSSPDEAYTYKHTDITIPYSELGSIFVQCMDGGSISIIEQGRFVLKGTEILNDALKHIEV